MIVPPCPVAAPCFSPLSISSVERARCHDIRRSAQAITRFVVAVAYPVAGAPQLTMSTTTNSAVIMNITAVPMTNLPSRLRRTMNPKADSRT